MIKLEQLSFRVGEQTLLHPLALQFPAGQVCGLIGHNGSGKSTLLKLLARQQAHEHRLGNQVIPLQQNTETVLPALENVRRRMPSLQGVIEDTIDDIEMFT